MSAHFHVWASQHRVGDGVRARFHSSPIQNRKTADSLAEAFIPFGDRDLGLVVLAGVDDCVKSACTDGDGWGR